MFKRVLSSSSRFSACLGGSAAAAAVVAISDKDLKKKPEWYQHAVLNLEDSLKKLGKYRPIESTEVLNNAQDLLVRVADYKSPEIAWRLGRVLVEKSDLSVDHHDKKHLLTEAVEHLHRALLLESANGCAGAHKWYAIALSKLFAFSKKLAKGHSEQEIIDHLEKAVKIDSKDPFSWHYLGIEHYNKKNYTDAIGALKKAEECRPDFSTSNKYYLGLSLYNSGNKEEATKTLVKAINLPKRTLSDGKANIRAKDFLLSKLKQKWEDINPAEDY